MKVLFLRTDFYGAVTDGGIASLHRGQINAYLKDKHNCLYASCGRMILPENVKYYFIPYSKYFRNFPEVYTLPHSKKAAKEVLKIIDIEQPDFLHHHHSDFNYAGTIIKRKTGIPFVLHCDGVEIWVKKNWGKLYFSDLLKWAEEIQWENADLINVPSSVVKKQMIEHGVDPSKILVNPNGVDPDVFHPDLDKSIIRKKLGIENNFVVGFVGTFGHWHGVDVLAESIKILKGRIPNIKVLFVGDGLLRPKIEEILKRDSVENISIITGMIPYLSIPEYMAACDVLTTPCVHNSDNSEFFNSPIKLFEYMSMGKPIVASDVGQQGEVINDYENGILCREKSAEDLADKIEYFYANPDEARIMGASARNSVVTQYDWRMYNKRITDRLF